MADTDVKVTFSADASGVASGAADASAAIKTFQTSIDMAAKSFSALKTAVDTAFKAPSTNGVQAALNDTDVAMDKAIKGWSRSISPMVSAFGRGVEQMVNHTKTLQQVWTSMLGQMENKLFQVLERQLTKWIATELAKTTASKAGLSARETAETASAAKSRRANFETNEKQIYNDAAAAAAAAYKSMAGIPLVGPALGAAAAAVSFTAVEAYGNLASAAGGYDIPSGVNPLTQLHQQEMVLPATLANPMRSMLSDYANSNGSGVNDNGGSSGAGDTHVHIHAVDAKSVKQLFSDHSDHMMSVINGKLRGGAKLTAG